MADLDLVAGVVLGHLSAGAGKVALAPAEAYAEHWKDRIKTRLDRTREAVEVKASGRPIEVGDRVAFKALTEAAFNDDSLVADYLGGVLAASGDGDDGVAIVSQIGRLSAAQLRFHYLIYREVRRLWDPEQELNLYQETEARRAGVRFRFGDLRIAMGEANMGLQSIIPVLHREGLIVGEYASGVEDGKAMTYRVRPSAPGAELFLWGHGVRPPLANRLFEPDLELHCLTDVPETPRTTLISTPLDPNEPIEIIIHRTPQNDDKHGDEEP